MNSLPLVGEDVFVCVRVCGGALYYSSVCVIYCTERDWGTNTRQPPKQREQPAHLSAPSFKLAAGLCHEGQSASTAVSGSLGFTHTL